MRARRPHPSRRAHAHSTLRERVRAPQDEDSRARGSSPNRFRNSRLTMSNSPSRSRGAFLRPGFAPLLHSPPSRGVGGAPRNVRVLSGTPVRRIMTRYARRLARRLASHDAGRPLSALHRGGFGLPGPRFRLLGRPPSYNGGQVPCGSVQRAPRTQVVVPGGRGPCLPRRTVTSRRRRTPRLTPHSGSSLEHALNERGCECSSMNAIRSQYL